MFCRNCGKELGPNAAVCVSCGAGVGTGQSYCWNCGNSLIANAAVCTQCGAAVGTAGSGHLGEKPGKVQAIAVLTLVGGIWAALHALGALLYIVLVGLGTFGIGCIALPLLALPVATAILGITKGIRLLGAEAQSEKPPKGFAILQICDILLCDVINCGCGIASLVLQDDSEVKRFFKHA